MSNLVLGLDTATERTVIALGAHEGADIRLISAEEIDAPRAALGRLLPALAEMLDREERVVRDVTTVVTGRGPGSFTGVRIGVATAKGLAHGLGVALWGVGTLDAIAWRIVRETDGLLGVLGDAMRGEVYPALFELEGGAVRRLGADRVAKPEVVAAEWAALERPLILAGTGLAKYARGFSDVLGDAATVAPEPLWRPTGAGLLAAYAHVRATDDAGTGDPGAMLPIYTRLSDAEEAERARAVTGR